METNFKILVVDDDPDTLTVLTDLLTEHGYAVVVAADGIEGVNIADKERPNLALVDTRLPKMDGYEVCRRIKEIKGLNTKVIMFTAYGDAVNVTKAKEVGADDFMAKTDDFANMHRAIENLLSGK
jgi:DNA-binding response OmpR family regulator